MSATKEIHLVQQTKSFGIDKFLLNWLKEYSYCIEHYLCLYSVLFFSMRSMSNPSVTFFKEKKLSIFVENDCSDCLPGFIPQSYLLQAETIKFCITYS